MELTEVSVVTAAETRWPLSLQCIGCFRRLCQCLVKVAAAPQIQREQTVVQSVENWDAALLIDAMVHRAQCIGRHRLCRYLLEAAAALLQLDSSKAAAPFVALKRGGGAATLAHTVSVPVEPNWQAPL